MVEKNKVVYLHRRKLDKKIFYVGIGNKKRPYDFTNRSIFWHNYVKKYGKPLIEIYKDNLTKEEAGLIEIDLIKKYGRRIKKEGCLVNLSSGGEFGLLGVNEKQVLCLKKGIVYNSINEYCKLENKIQPVISNFLNNKKYTKKDYFVRLIINNKIKWINDFDENIERKDDTFSIKNNMYFISSENNQNKYLKKINKLSDIEKALLYLSTNNSILFLAKKYNLNYYSFYNEIIYIKNKVLGINYKNKYNTEQSSNLKTIENIILKDYYSLWN